MGLKAHLNSSLNFMWRFKVTHFFHHKDSWTHLNLIQPSFLRCQDGRPAIKAGNHTAKRCKEQCISEIPGSLVDSRPVHTLIHSVRLSLWKNRVWSRSSLNRRLILQMKRLRAGFPQPLVPVQVVLSPGPSICWARLHCFSHTSAVSCGVCAVLLMTSSFKSSQSHPKVHSCCSFGHARFGACEREVESCCNFNERRHQTGSDGQADCLATTFSCGELHLSLLLTFSLFNLLILFVLQEWRSFPDKMRFNLAVWNSSSFGIQPHQARSWCAAVASEVHLGLLAS